MAMTVERACSWTTAMTEWKLPVITHSQSTKCCAFRARASLSPTGDAGICRRHILLGVGSLAASTLCLSNHDALAKVPSGYQAVLDKFDKYQFLYPFGWQEVSVKGQDCVYKDVIEPLESVSVNITETNKSDVRELGTAEEVAKTLVSKVLTSSSQKAQLLEAKEREADGRTYYTFEFVAKAPNYTCHAVSTVTVADGKFYTITTGAKERRWPKMQDKPRVVADSFSILE